MPVFAIEQGHERRWRVSTLADLAREYGTRMGARQRRVIRKFAVGVLRSAPSGGPYAPGDNIPAAHLGAITHVAFLTSDAWLGAHAPQWILDLEWSEELDPSASVDDGPQAQAALNFMLGEEMHDEDALEWNNRDDNREE